MQMKHIEIQRSEEKKAIRALSPTREEQVKVRLMIEIANPS
jgi:hypothetical protein